MKQQLLDDIRQGLLALNITPVTDDRTDIVISEEFLDASGAAGDMNITYNAFIFADVSSSTLYMFEDTSESETVNIPLSAAEAAVDAGKAVFHHVRSIQTAADGSIFERELNLEDISEAVKNAAHKHDWRLKIVFSRGKAIYPPGYSKDSSNPSDTSVEVIADDRFSEDSGHLKTKEESNTYLAKAQLIQRKMGKNTKKNRGCLFPLILLAVILVGLGYGSTKEMGITIFSSPRISNAAAAAELNSDTYVPVDPTSEFSSSLKKIYVSAYAKSVRSGTQVSVLWHLPDNKTVSSEKAFTLKADGWVPFFLSSETGFPTGSYSVDILVNGEVSKTLTFTVK